LKAALAAASEPGGDATKAIGQRHLEEGIRDVLAAKRVMRQSLLDDAIADRPEPGWLDPRLPWTPGSSTPLALLLAAGAVIIALVALVVAIVR
jgi:hypothetical protein